MKIDDNKDDLIIKKLLEEYLIEDVEKQMESFGELEEPNYSEEHKKFINEFFEKVKNKKKKRWKKWGSVAAVVWVCVIMFNQNITAEIKEIFNNVSTKQTEISFDVKKKTMYVEYDLNAFPKGWDVLYLPNDMKNGYIVKEVKGNETEIQILFVNAKGDKLLYTLSKEQLNLIGDSYEKIDINEIQGYHFENTNELILESKRNGVSFVKMEPSNMSKEDLIWIAKNIVYVYR